MQTEQDDTSLRRTAIFFAAGAIAGACNVALTLVLLALLGGAGYKTFGLAQSASVFAMALAFEWLRIYALRFFAERDKFGTVYGLYGASALVLLIFAAGAALLAPNFIPGGALGLAGVLVAVLAIVQAVGDFLIVMGRGAGVSGLVLGVQAGRALLTLGASVITALATGSAYAALAAMAGAHFTASLVGAVAYRRALPPPAKFDPRTARTVFAFGLPMMASALLTAQLAMADRWIISLPTFALPAVLVGGYIALSDLAIRVLSFFSSVLVGAFVQDIAKAYDAGAFEIARARIRIMATAWLAAATPLACAGALLTNDIAALIYPEAAARPANGVIVAIVCAVAAHVLRNTLIETLLLIAKRTWLVLAINFLCLAGAAALSVALMRAHGLIGAPLGFLGAAIAAAAVSFPFVHKDLRAGLGAPRALAIVAAALLAVVAAQALGAHAASGSLARLSAFGLTYVIVLALFMPSAAFGLIRLIGAKR